MRSFVYDRATRPSLIFEIRSTTFSYMSIKTRVPPSAQPVDDPKAQTDNFAAYLHQQNHARRLAITLLYSFAASRPAANHLIKIDLGP